MANSELSPREHHDLRLLLIGTLLNGFVGSLNTYQDIIAKKALHATDWQIAILAMVWPIAIFFSIWWGQIIGRTHDKSRLFWLVALGGRLTLVFGLWITGFFHLLFVLLLVYLMNGLLMPLQNSLLQSNFQPGRRGQVFGYTASITTLVTLITSLIFGRVLDHHEAWFRESFVLLGLLGFTGIVTMAKIPFRPRPEAVPCEQAVCRNLLFGPIARSIAVLRDNSRFRRFEIAFFTYGMGFMMLDAMMPHYLVTMLHINYTQAFFAKGVLAQLGMLVLSPWAGKKLDRVNPMLFTSISMGLICLYPVILYASSWMPHVWAIRCVFLAYFVMGIAMVGLNLSWNVSSIFFAGKNDASMYQGVHVTLNSIRGLIAPFTAYAVLSLLSMRMLFVVAFGFFAASSYLSGRQYLKFRKMKNWLMEVVKL